MIVLLRKGGSHDVKELNLQRNEMGSSRWQIFYQFQTDVRVKRCIKVAFSTRIAAGIMIHPCRACLTRKGPYIKDVRKISGIFDPLPPLSAFLPAALAEAGLEIAFKVGWLVGPSTNSWRGR